MVVVKRKAAWDWDTQCQSHIIDLQCRQFRSSRLRSRRGSCLVRGLCCSMRWSTAGVMRWTEWTDIDGPAGRRSGTGRESLRPSEWRSCDRAEDVPDIESTKHARPSDRLQYIQSRTACYFLQQINTAQHTALSRLFTVDPVGCASYMALCLNSPTKCQKCPKFLAFNWPQVVIFWDYRQPFMALRFAWNV